MLPGIGTNIVKLCGRAGSAAVFSHRTHDKGFWVLPLEIGRHSGVSDAIMVMIAEDKLRMCSAAAGAQVCVSGQLRSFNNRTDNGSRLILTVFAVEIENTDGEDENSVLLEGVLCKPPIYRKTPLGREICDLMLAVGRKYGRADYLPCIAWGATARACSEYMPGTRLKLEGRLQSRKYMKLSDGAYTEKTAYEVSASTVEKL
jgi:primosomal replication protein N